MNKVEKLKAIVKNKTVRPTFGTNPSDPWSAKANIAESPGLDAYLKSRGINPEFASKDVKIAHSKSNAFLQWQRAHMREDVAEPLDEVSVNTLASYKKKAGQDVNARALKVAMQKDDPLRHPSTPDSREKDAKKRASRITSIVKAGEKLKSKGYQEPKPAPDTADRGYGKGRYMGDSVELEGDTLDEVSSELLGRYKEKAKKSADSLTSAGQHKKATDRHMNVMKATGKQMSKTISNLKKSLRVEDKYEDPKAATQTPDVMAEKKKSMSKSAELIKSIYKNKKMMKEDLYDHEKADKSVATYGKKPKFDAADKKDSQGENKPKAAAVLSGGTTLTGQSRDTIEIDPMMRVRPGQPDPTKDKDKDKKKEEDKSKK